MARNTVGKSGVTPTKHFLLNSLLGQEAGTYAGGHLQRWCDSALWIDLTAGDGEPTRTGKKPENSCSAGIFTKHANHVAKHKKPLSVHLIEVNESTYDKLNVSLQNRWLKEFPDARDIVKTKNEDSSRICLNVSNSTACFLNNDPNSIDDWAFTPDLLESAPPFTRTLTTMGCNVGGLKRVLIKSPELSDKWRKNIEMLFALQRHELILFAVGDASQWAYLISTPDKWLEETVKLCIKSHKFQTQAKREPRVVTTKEPKKFDLLLDELLMTQKQLEEKNFIQTELGV